MVRHLYKKRFYFNFVKARVTFFFPDMKVISVFVSYTYFFFMYIMGRKFILYDGESIQLNETVFFSLRIYSILSMFTIFTCIQKEPVFSIYGILISIAFY